MSGDYSRLTLDARRNYAGVQLQQGRPLTDADWNEQAAMIARRVQASMLDTVGRAVVPRALPDGFRIALTGGQLSIGRGRMYVDGLLVENHGSGAAAWDTQLAERIGSGPTPYATQPYLPVAPDLPTAGSWVAYLDVWQREVCALQDSSLAEKALGGVDTTTRLQTLWQVKLRPVAGARASGSVNCANALQNDSGWSQLLAPPSSRLSSATAVVPGEPDPCLIPPGTGYKGLENQLYRVEIHQGGTAAQASFKWSRDNASVETRVARIVDATHIVVDSTGRDEVLNFSDGDWIEFVDESRELGALPGELRRIRVGGVDAATRRITLDKPLPAGGEFAPGVPDAARALRIRRWDQQGRVRRADGTLHADLDSTGGAIPIPAAGTQLLLENGVVVSFAAQPAGGRYRVGEWWVFAARAADASIDELKDAPPRGPHHHYAKLAVVHFPLQAQPEDCRVLWPPEAAQGEGCACTICVSPAAHADGSMTIQMAIAEVQRRGGGTVCLELGDYLLPSRLEINAARSLRLRGQGSGTVLRAPAEALSILDSRDVRVEDLSIRAQDIAPEPAPGDVRPTPGLQPVGELSLLRNTSTRSFRIGGDAQRMDRFSMLSTASASGLREASEADRRETGDAAPAATEDALPEALVSIQRSAEVVLRGLWLQSRPAEAVRETAGASAQLSGVGVLLVDATPELQIEHCRIVAPIGVLSASSSEQSGDTEPAATVLRANVADSAICLQANRIESSYACVALASDLGIARLLIADNALRAQRFGLFLGSMRNARLQLSGNDIRASFGAMIGSTASLEVRANLLRGASQEGASSGLLLMGLGSDKTWGMVNIHDNLIGGLRGVAIGVGGAVRGMSLHLSRNRVNSVGRGLVFSGFVATMPGSGQAGERDESAVAESIRIEDNEFLRLRGSGDATDGDIPEPCALALRAIHLRVAGNVLQGGNGEPLVGVDADAHCEFSSNRGERAADERLNRFADVHLRVGTAVVASNYMRGSTETALAIEPQERERRRCTVLGNITRGNIRVRGAETPTALAEFNVIDASL